MKKMAAVVVVALLGLSLVIAGCGANKEASGSAAIQKSETMGTVQQKVDYLIAQAKSFISSKQYDQAVSVAQHILTKFDSNSQEARSLLEEAKNYLATQAKAKVDEVKKQFGGFGKEYYKLRRG